MTNLRTVKLGLPRGQYVRVDRETARGWKVSRVYRIADASRIRLAVNEALSCGCGSYAFGECELCDLEAKS